MKTSKEINRNWLIKAYQKGVLNTLLGVKGLISLIGEERVEKFTERASRSLEDKCCCKVYGTGLKITFYAH